VGAIVLLSSEGDVLAAASEPDEGSFIDPGATGERQYRRERTLKKPTFQPPGSSIKVFMAARALEHGLDPARTVTCAPLASGGAGYGDMRCWNSSGHGVMDLHSALEQSCNAYFAWLGETMKTAEFVEVCHEFGFGAPTGVRRAPPWDDGLFARSGLSEDRAGLALPDNGGELSVYLRRRVANGLARIEVTPMQLARAMLALGTGGLRELRLVQSVGARELPRGEPRPLSIGVSSLDFVRRAMADVAAAPLGSARNALSFEDLGVRVAVKTGSADIMSRQDQGDPKVLKHTWVAGWLPAEKPELVFVVFVHRTMATSSHGAVYVARQLLRQPEVRAWVAARGVELAEVGR
jgi:penicillin-binding protein 2